MMDDKIKEELDRDAQERIAKSITKDKLGYGEQDVVNAVGCAAFCFPFLTTPIYWLNDVPIEDFSYMMWTTILFSFCVYLWKKQRNRKWYEVKREITKKLEDPKLGREIILEHLNNAIADELYRRESDLR